MPLPNSSKSKGCQVSELRWGIMPISSGWHILDVVSLKSMIRLEIQRFSVCSMLGRRYKQEMILLSTGCEINLGRASCFKSEFPLLFLLFVCFILFLLLQSKVIHFFTEVFNCQLLWNLYCLLPPSISSLNLEIKPSQFDFSVIEMIGNWRVLCFYLLSFTCLRPQQYSDIICSIWIFHHMMHIICFHN